MTLLHKSSSRSWGGVHEQYEHVSKALNCTMRFAIFLPPQAEARPVPVLYWLSGLTCNDENFMQKAGAHRMAAELGVAIVAPDTSPRGEGVADAPDGAYDLGLGAGFYVNASQTPWRSHYQMYDYVVTELPQLIDAEFPVTERRAISGHSMGGHGALVIALRNPSRYVSVSAFSPIAHPIECPWGQKAFTAYLGDDRRVWQQYDATELINAGATALPALVDQGDADDFLARELKPEALREAAERHRFPLEMRLQPGYDHSYYFIATFIDDHLRFHSRHLLG